MPACREATAPIGTLGQPPGVFMDGPVADLDEGEHAISGKRPVGSKARSAMM
jgi:hypothetical protein